MGIINRTDGRTQVQMSPPLLNESYNKRKYTYSRVMSNRGSWEWITFNKLLTRQRISYLYSVIIPDNAPRTVITQDINPQLNITAFLSVVLLYYHKSNKFLHINQMLLFLETEQKEEKFVVIGDKLRKKTHTDAVFCLPISK